MEITNLSFWETTNFYNTEVLIVGSGIVGLNAAITIKKLAPKLHVTILERGFLPSGASTKNAGFACFGSISELIEQEKIAGTEVLYQLIEKRWKGLQKLRSIVGDQQLAFENNGGFELFTPPQQTLLDECVSKIGHYNQLLKDITGEEGTFKVADDRLTQFGFHQTTALIENRLEAQLDPGKMIKALIALAASLGVVILNNCDVKSFNVDERKVQVVTSLGNFNCSKLLCCNNAFANQLFPELDLKPGRGQVLITKPIENLAFKGAFHYDKGYYYFRNVGNRVLLGGGRNLDFFTEQTHQFGETPLVQNTLLRLLKDVILPNTSFEVEQKWSGIMAFGPQLSPIIEEVEPNIFCAVRCNGMGIAIGTQTGEEAGEMVVGGL
ncbi:NAD(P)/FAD-dependent oxidoreductase [Nubsella zeaxanthinifaciens]|uniref:NAD(P)/FAD-dependent oxidoreductase n=1 Tax=Nubsella zeaxanthinifaciens TaxID=392412 RepID=UPI000DE44CB2|nr:FAD-binding oxidoreductase [Nubsella zeaxanthinifaciens]